MFFVRDCVRARMCVIIFIKPLLKNLSAVLFLDGLILFEPILRLLFEALFFQSKGVKKKIKIYTSALGESTVPDYNTGKNWAMRVLFYNYYIELMSSHFLWGKT